MEQSSTKVAKGGISVKFAAAYWASSTQINCRLGLFWTDKFGLEQLPPNISMLPFLRVIYPNKKLLSASSLHRFKLLFRFISVSCVFDNLKSFRLELVERSILVKGPE